jgi:hypothetical protein
MSISWEEKEEIIKNSFTRIVYSDEDEFYENESPYRIIFITKIGTYSYVVKYHTFLHTFTRYRVPYYNRKCADLVLKEKSDPLTAEDVNTNDILQEQYRV